MTAWNVMYAPPHLACAVGHFISTTDVATEYSSLSGMVIDLARDTRQAVVTKEGVFISTRLFLPFEAMDAEQLRCVRDMIEHDKNCTSFKVHDTTSDIALLFAAEHESNTIGIARMLCAILVLVQSIPHADDSIKFSVFDVIIQSTLHEFTLDLPKLLIEFERYGYCSQ